MRDLNRIGDVVHRTLSDAFRAYDDVRVVSVAVTDDIDADDNPVLRIQVILEGDPSTIEASKISGLVRELRPYLMEIDEPAFPLLSLISKSDMRTRKRASA